jgi:hypothetical protein
VYAVAEEVWPKLFTGHSGGKFDLDGKLGRRLHLAADDLADPSLRNPNDLGEVSLGTTGLRQKKDFKMSHVCSI